MIIALLALGIFVILGRIAAKVLVNILVRSQVPRSHQAFFRTVARWAFIIAGLVVALNIVGLKGLAASLVASGGVTAIVLGFAFRGVGENFLAGFFLVMGRTFRINDVIRSGEFEGEVRAIELRHTHIRAADGRDIYIPSIEIFSKPLVNYTRDGLRRLTFTLGIDYADDSERARKVLVDSIARVEGVLKEPSPGARIREFAENFVQLEAHFWIDTFKQQGIPANVRTDVMEKCRRAILEAGFTVSSEVSANVAIGGRAPMDVRVQQDA